MKKNIAIKILLAVTILFHYNEMNGQRAINTADINFESTVNTVPYISYIADTALLNIETVNQKKQTDWLSLSNVKGINMGISNKYYWFRFQIHNSGKSTDTYYLLNSNRGINELELFKKKDGQIISMGRTGDHFPFYQRPFPSGNFIYPLTINAGDTVTYYLFINKKNENLNFNLHVITEDNLHVREKNIQLYMGLFCGILMLGFIISLFLFFIFKDKLPFWYSIYIVAVLNRLLTFEGFDFQYFYPSHPFYADISRYIASSILLALLTYIMQIFCNQQASNSKFFRTTNALRWMAIIFIPVTFIIYQYYPLFFLKRIHFIFFIIMQTVGVFILALSCFEKMMQRFKPASFYFMAVVMLLFSGGFAILQEIGVVNHSYDTPNLIQWSFIIEMILIIIGILYRYNLIKIENENLFNDLNEEKVNSIKQILDTQQKEQQRIAEDLHDILGSQMAVIKMKVTALNEDAEKKEGLIHLIDDVVLNTRNIAHNLAPVELHHNAISDIVSSYLVKLNSIQSIHFTFIQTGNPVSFTKEEELDLYKIIMEIIQNILNHSQATEASIQFFFNNDNFEIFAEDNGVGIPAEKSKGMGINNITKRVKNLNGKIHIDSIEGNTTFIITIPLHNEPAN